MAECVGMPMAPADSPGAARACAHSVENPDNSRVYFAGGYCSYYAQRCTSNGGLGSLICGAVAAIGDIDTFRSCPAPFILSRTVETASFGTLGSADIEITFCLKPCTTDSDCRVRQFDDVFDEFARYTCTTGTIDGVSRRYCIDDRL